MKELYEKLVKNGRHVVVAMREIFENMAINIIVRMMASEGYFSTIGVGDKESGRCQNALGDFFYLLVLFLVSDTILFLGWLDLVIGYVGKELD